MSDQVTVSMIYYKRNYIFKHNYVGTFGVSCGMLSNVISLISMDIDTDSENLSFFYGSLYQMATKHAAQRIYY